MKKTIISVGTLIAAFVLTSCGPAANNTTNKPANAANTANTTTTSTANADAEIKKIMEELASELAKNDADAASKHYADDYQLVGPSGSVQTKAERLADMKSGASKFESFSYNDIKVRTYGDMAIAITTVKLKGTVAGRPAPPEARATLVFRKMGDTWKVVSGQATPILAPTAPTTTSNTANTAPNANK